MPPSRPSRQPKGGSALGGLRAYIGTLRKDRSPSHSRRSSRPPPRRPGSPRGRCILIGDRGQFAHPRRRLRLLRHHRELAAIVADVGDLVRDNQVMLAGSVRYIERIPAPRPPAGSSQTPR